MECAVAVEHQDQWPWKQATVQVFMGQRQAERGGQSSAVLFIIPHKTWIISEPGTHRRNEDPRGNENRISWNKIFSVGKKSTSILFFSMKVKIIDLWLQIEGTKLIFVMNFSVLDFSNCTDFSLNFQNFPWGGGGGGGGGGEHGRGPPLEMSSLFFMDNSSLCCIHYGCMMLLFTLRPQYKKKLFILN